MYWTAFTNTFGRVTASSESVYDNVWFSNIVSKVFMWIHTNVYNIGRKSDVTMCSHNMDTPPYNTSWSQQWKEKRKKNK